MASEENNPDEQPKPDQATRSIVEQRVLALVQLRLDGARGWDLCQFVAEKEQAGEHPWTMGADNKPLCRRSIERYASKADDMIAEMCATVAKHSLSLHLARRESMYGKAMKAGDLQAALAILKDKAALEDLYPAKTTKSEVTGRGGGPMELQHSGKLSHESELTASDVAFALSIARAATSSDLERGVHTNGHAESLDQGSDPGHNGNT